MRRKGGRACRVRAPAAVASELPVCRPYAQREDDITYRIDRTARAYFVNIAMLSHVRTTTCTGGGGGRNTCLAPFYGYIIDRASGP